MSKEQLEMAIDIRNYIDGQGEYDEEVEAMDWLKEQAERVQELEESRKEIAQSFRDERELNKRYREGIETSLGIARANALHSSECNDMEIILSSVLESESNE